MLRIILVRPGSTDFDDQKRIKGSLDIPLNENGTNQVAQTVGELSDWKFDAIYRSPCQSAEQTAKALANGRAVKIKQLDKFKNLDHGLWHGKLIDEVKHNQPKVYRQWQDHPEQICPPEGETLVHAQSRVRLALTKLLKKHKTGAVALVVPEPLASVVSCMLACNDLGDLWKLECACGGWEMIEIEPEKVALSS